VSASVGVLATTASPLTDGTSDAAVDAASAVEAAEAAETAEAAVAAEAAVEDVEAVEAVDASVGVFATAEPWDVIGSGTLC
jgi:hypothetical protein